MTIIEQFQDMKRRHPDAVLLFRCGDFYELYDKDAEVASTILGITLTKRNGNGMAIAGFPYHALDTYLPKLIRAGKRVAIADEITDPKSKKTIKKTTSSNNSKTPNETMETKTTIPTENNEKMYHQFNAENYIRSYFYYHVHNILYSIESCYADYDLDGHNERFYIKLSSGLTLQVPFDTPLYESEEHYRRGIQLENVFSMVGEQTLIRNSFRRTTIHNGKCCYIVDDNGKPIYWDIREHINEFRRRFGHYEATPEYPDIPGQYERFSSMAEYYKWNDLRVIDKDGKESVVKSLRKQLLLTPEQRTLFEAAKTAMEAAKNAGVCFVHDNYNCEGIYAINGNAFDDISCDADYVDENKYDMVEADDLLRDDVEITTRYVNEGHVFLIKKQKKD